MNARTAGVVADALLVSAGLAVTYVIVTRPPLRRLAFQLIQLWLRVGVPIYVAGASGGPQHKIMPP